MGWRCSSAWRRLPEGQEGRGRRFSCLGPRDARLEGIDLRESVAHLVTVTDDADEIIHDHLQLSLDRERILVTRSIEGTKCPFGCGSDLSVGQRGRLACILC
jgi:hypothetical protein